MNARQADERNYTFEGTFTSDHDKLMARKKAIKEKGFKVVTITEPHTRFGTKKWSLYVEARYFVAKEREELLQRIESMPARKEKLIAELEAEEKDLRARLEAINDKLATVNGG